MTLREAAALGITKIRLRAWKSDYYLEIIDDETGIVYTPGDTDRVPNIVNGKLFGTKLVKSEKRKVNLGPYLWGNAYEAYDEAEPHTP